VRLHCIVVFFSFDNEICNESNFLNTKEVYNSYVSHQCKTLPIEQACRYFSFSFSLVGLAGSLVRFVYGSWSIFSTFFSIIKIKTPCTTNFIIFGLNRVMAYKNSFTSGHIILNCTSSKSKMLTCKTHSKSLLVVHLWNFSISKKIIFPLLEIITTIFSLFMSS
jgi:hypothetical protein